MGSENATMNEAENNVYNEGFEAQDNGALKNENPYTLKTSLYDLWEMGWQEGTDADYEQGISRE